jgi:hypothetical protein
MQKCAKGIHFPKKNWQRTGKNILGNVDVLKNSFLKIKPI